MVSVNIDKAKAVAHDKRRTMRAAELEPLDAQVNWYIADAAKQTEIEAQRQVVRDKYVAMQTNIDAATDIAGIKAALVV